MIASAGGRLCDRRQERRRRPRVRLRDQHRDEELHLHRPRRCADRQLADALGVRREVRRAELLVLQRDRREQQDPVQPRSGRARRGGGAVADHRHQRVPGDREQEDGVDRRRLHHAGQLPVLAVDDAVERHRRLQRGRPQPAAARQAGVLHPQLGEGHRRRLRRHRDAVRTGRAGPGAAGVDEGVPGHREAQERHLARTAAASALPRGPVQGAARHCWPSTTSTTR